MNEPQKKPGFGQLQLPAIDAKLKTAPATPEGVGELSEEIQFSTFITRGTYLRLLQRMHWEPGFVIKDATEAAINAFLDKTPEFDKPLPPARLGKLLQTNKKLRSK